MGERVDADAAARAVLLSTQSLAEYWLDGGRKAENSGEAFLCAENSANVWKNAAYAWARRALIAEAGEWQPIETAPRDGTAILVRQPWRSGYNEVMPAHYANGWVWQAACDRCGMHEIQPTHWRPMPRWLAPVEKPEPSAAIEWPFRREPMP